MVKKVLIEIGISTLILIIGIFIVAYYQSDDNRIISTKKTISSYNHSINTTQFKITNQEELDAFCELFPDYTPYNIPNFDKKSIFIKLYSASNILDYDYTLTDELKINVQQFPYNPYKINSLIVLEIPKSQLKNVNLDNWTSPIKVKNNL